MGGKRINTELHPCEVCEEPTRNPRFCQKACANKSYNTTWPTRKRTGPPCGHCGGPTARAERKYCSVQCRGLAQRQQDPVAVPSGAKYCAVCAEVKDASDFNKNAARRDGKDDMCRSCRKTYFAAWTDANPERAQALRRTAWKQVRVKRIRIDLVLYLLEHPCIDCGYADVRALEFDHVSGVKRAGVFNLVIRGASDKQVWDEVAKCEVRVRQLPPHCQRGTRRVVARRGV
jgi:hypothetical protein